MENHISIISIIIWLKSDRNNNEGRISYLTGGDSHSETEAKMKSLLGDRNIPVIKASHHGSRTSTPFDLLSHVRPDKIIIAAGYEHGHPSMYKLRNLRAITSRVEPC